MSVETVNWPTLKALLDVVPIDFGYVETVGYYYVYTSGIISLACAISRDGSTDDTEFEASYKSNASDFVYEHINRYQNITGSGTTAIKGGPGFLHGISINNNTTGGTVTLYDSPTASGTKIMTLQVGSATSGPVSLDSLDIRCNFGLTVETAGSADNDITVYYR